MSAWQTTYEGPEGTVSIAAIARYAMVVTPDTAKGKGYAWSVTLNPPKGNRAAPKAVGSGHRRSLSSAREAASTAALSHATEALERVTA